MAGLNLFTNNAATTLASGINNVVTSLTVATGTGALFPNPTAGQYFYCTLANNAGTVEIVKVTARSSDTFTVVRGQDGTSAVSWNSGDKVELRLVNADLTNFGQLDSTNTWALAQTFTAAPTFSQAPVLSSLTASKPVFTDASKNLTSSGTLGIDQGGTGQTTKTAAFDALAPTTTNGDMMYFNGTDVVRLPIGSTDQVLKVSGGIPAWGTDSGGFTNMDIITASTTWTVPAGVTKMRVTVVGGGGGGAGFISTGSSGGGDGGVAVALLTGVTGSISVTIGSGGTQSNTGGGGGGGTTSFGSYLSATGGAGGAYGTTTPAADGAGTVSSGTTIRTVTSNIYGAASLVYPTQLSGIGLQIGEGGPIAFSLNSYRGAGKGGSRESTGTTNNAAGGMGGAVMIEY